MLVPVPYETEPKTYVSFGRRNPRAARMKEKLHKVVENGKPWQRCVLLHLEILRGKTCFSAGVYTCLHVLHLYPVVHIHPERLHGEVLPPKGLLEGGRERNSSASSLSSLPLAKVFHTKKFTLSHSLSLLCIFSSHFPGQVSCSAMEFSI